jgi:hypothetical protein
MREALMLSKFKLPFPKSLQSLITSSFMIGQHFLKKAPLKPSGPGAWSDDMSLRTTEISSKEKGLSRTDRSVA